MKYDVLNITCKMRSNSYSASPSDN